MAESTVKINACKNETKIPSPTKIAGRIKWVRVVNTPNTIWSPVMFIKSLKEREIGLTM